MKAEPKLRWINSTGKPVFLERDGIIFGFAGKRGNVWVAAHFGDIDGWGITLRNCDRRETAMRLLEKEAAK